MTYYDDYIREKAAQAFDIEKAEFKFYQSKGWTVGDPAEGVLDDDHCNQVFEGAMNEMVSYIFDRIAEHGEDEGETPNTSLLWDAENVEDIYISAWGLTAPIVVVDYHELPEWFGMKNAELREFYYHPNPADSGEWTAAYFQPR